MEIWAIIGFITAVVLVFVVALWVTSTAVKTFNFSTNTAGLALVVVSMTYASYVTWVITSGNIPFTGG